LVQIYKTTPILSSHQQGILQMTNVHCVVDMWFFDWYHLIIFTAMMRRPFHLRCSLSNQTRGLAFPFDSSATFETCLLKASSRYWFKVKVVTCISTYFFASPNSNVWFLCWLGAQHRKAIGWNNTRLNSSASKDEM
jgi:hypothetical protein